MGMTMFSARRITLSLVASLIAVTAAAQDSTSVRETPSKLARRFSYSVAFTQSRPQDELARNVGIGYGISAAALFRLDEAGMLAIRADLSGLQYGTASRPITLGDAAGSNIALTLRTSNYIMPMSVGPQVMWPSGVLRPYLNAGIGMQAYFTETTLEGDRVGSHIASTTNQSDAVASLTVGGGVYAALPVRGRKVELDAGVQYLDGGRARYLAAANVDATTGALTTTPPVESSAHLLVLKLGARIGW
jgi:hypothetical protein